MQFGVFSVGDVTGDPTPTEAERIGAKVEIAVRAEKVGLDVFATGEHHNPAFVPSSPTTMPRLHRHPHRALDPLHRHHPPSRLRPALRLARLDPQPADGQAGGVLR